MNAKLTADHSTPSRAWIAAAILGALASGVTAVSSAATAYDAPTAMVHYADLDISSSQGASTLYWRIRLAADAVCSPLDHGSLASRMNKRACVQKAIKGAVAKINQPTLFDIYDANNGQSGPTTFSAANIR